jgi:uncharacterized Zn finger protein (UPF0148 family)
MWSRKYERCRECGTTERKHSGKGYCYRCYNRRKYHENPEPQKARSREYYSKHGEAKRAYQKEYHQATREERLAYMKMKREEEHFGGLRSEALERDGHQCTTPGCGATEQLVVHHRDGKGRGCPDPNNSLNNLETKCRACHVRIHVPRLGTGRVKI